MDKKILFFFFNFVFSNFILPDIFSTIPIIGIFNFLQKLISFLTSFNETSCGVVTIIAPSGSFLFNISVSVICSSLVPGGVSINKISNSPQYTSILI